ncbi:MAG: putative salt-induced outer membrane protein YdiY [Cognaticolwellia sp.]|jgi:putative salt-induced outer membrane protein YdiY
MLAMLMMNAALAQDVDTVDFKETEKAIEEAEAPEADLSAEVGGAMTTGNTDFWTVKGTINGGYRWEANKVTLTAMGLTGRNRSDSDGDGILSEDERLTDRQLNALKFDSNLRYDRFLGPKASVYAMGGAYIDTFAGVEYRLTEQAGYSRKLVDSDTTKLMVELGAAVIQEQRVIPVDAAEDFVDYETIFAARALIGFSHTFNENVNFSETIEAYENVLSPEDLRLINRAALTMQLSDNLALKLSNDLYYDNTPVEGFRKLDQTTMLSVVASIL